MASLLEQLKTMTVVVADTGDLPAIETWRPQDVTTNPTLLTTAVQQPAAQPLVEAALTKAQAEAGAAATTQQVVALCTDHLAVELGTHILSLISGRVSTEIDARLSHDTQASIAKAHRLIDLYEKSGVPRQRVLIKLASTYEGILAAQHLEKEDIHCNLTLLFGLHQAVACAEAQVTLISPFVGRILDWHKKHTGRTTYAPAEDPGVQSVTTIYHYFKHFGYKTEIMGASFRNVDEITELSGCDLLTIAPPLLQQLKETSGVLERKLNPQDAKNRQIIRLPSALDKTTFAQRHAQDPVATDKLAEGIQGFVQAIETLEDILTKRLHSYSGGRTE